MAIEVTEYTFPSFLASALVNNDRSGLEHAADIECLERIEAQLAADGFYIVDVARDENGEAKEERFTWSYRLYGGAFDGGSVLDYVAHKVTK